MLAWLGTAAGSAWLTIGVAGFLLCALWETLTPDRAMERGAAKRWVNNLILYAAGVALGAAIVPQWISLEPRLAFKAIQNAGGDVAVLVAGILGLDLLVYALHRAEHRLFFLWRFHAVHHSDSSVDASTALRHHPLEFVAVGVMMMGAAAAAGAPVWLFPVFNLVSFVTALFQHVNVALPEGVERRLRAVLVSPGMHRAHHSDNPGYYNSNFGNIFSFWDRLFGSYRRIPAGEAAAVRFGIEGLEKSGRWDFLMPWIVPVVLRRSR